MLHVTKPPKGPGCRRVDFKAYMAIDMVVFMIEVPEFKRHGVCSMILDA